MRLDQLAAEGLREWQAAQGGSAANGSSAAAADPACRELVPATSVATPIGRAPRQQDPSQLPGLILELRKVPGGTSAASHTLAKCIREVAKRGREDAALLDVCRRCMDISATSWATSSATVRQELTGVPEANLVERRLMAARTALERDHHQELQAATSKKLQIVISLRSERNCTPKLRPDACLLHET